MTAFAPRIPPGITLTSPSTALGRWTLKFRRVNLLDRAETRMTGEFVDDGAWRMSASTLTERWRLRRPLGPEDAVVPGTFS
nr:hypothetical protein [Nocardia beijingensis]